MKTETVVFGSERHNEIMKAMNKCSRCGKSISYETSIAYENGLCSDCMEFEYQGE